MTRDDIAVKLAEKYDNFSKATAKGMVKEMFEIMAEGLREVGSVVDISGFGKWKVVEAPERKGVNPKTKESLIIPAHPKLNFKASKTLKDGLKK